MPLYLEDRPTEVVLIADVYGVLASDIHVEYDDGRVRISGRRNNVEIACGCNLSVPVEAHNATADVRDGKLTVRLPKALAARRHVIRV